MDHSHRFGSRRAAAILVAAATVLLILAACGSSQAAIEQAVNATGTANQREANAVASAVAATFAAAPPTTAAQSPEPVGQATAEPPASDICPVPFPDLVARSSGYLEGGRFMVTLQKGEAFLDPEYILLINGLPYTCTPIAGQPENRVYCIGRPLPPVGEATVELLAGDSSCRIEIPFDTISVPPVPQPTSSGSYY